MNIWDNNWSEYALNSNVEKVDTLADIKGFKDLKNALKEIEVSLKDHLSIPYSYGMLYDYKNEQNYVFIILIRMLLY